MAQPANSFDSYDAVGIREDLQDMIYNIDPEETPFFTACAKMRASNTLHEWQTDTIGASEDNAHIEGDDTVAESVTPTVRLGNYTQIFKNAVVIPGTDSGLKKAGRAREMAYQLVQIGKRHKLSIEKALFANQARQAGSGTTPRRLAGAPAWIATNTANVGSGGSDPTGDGTDARTDGTQTVFGQTDFDLVMQSIWEEGGKPDTVYLSSFQMNKALGFTGNNAQRSTISADGKKVVNAMAVYVTPWGTVEFKPTRENRARDVFIMQSDMWAVGTLRPTFTEELAKTGDNEKRQIITELTLICKNEQASGIVADCSTS